MFHNTLLFSLILFVELFIFFSHKLDWTYVRFTTFDAHYLILVYTTFHEREIINCIVLSLVLFIVTVNTILDNEGMAKKIGIISLKRLALKK